MFYLGVMLIILVGFLSISGLLVLVRILKFIPKTLEDSVKVTNLNRKYKKITSSIQDVISDIKKTKAEKLTLIKNPEPISNSKVFYISFKGDVMAKNVEKLREEISVVLGVANSGDEVLLSLESPGGIVHGYGLAASQLERVKAAGLKLTICVDRCAASGGYMMACVADEIVAAPFAILGSIGVVMEYPNFYELLDKVGVKYHQLTAGKYKRTISPYLKPSEEGTEKAKVDLARTHDLFKSHISKHRPKLDIEKVATGETWYGSECVENGLIDRLATSDEVLFERMKSVTVFRVEHKESKKPTKLLSSLVSDVTINILDKFLDRIHESKLLK